MGTGVLSQQVTEDFQPQTSISEKDCVAAVIDLKRTERRNCARQAHCLARAAQLAASSLASPSPDPLDGAQLVGAEIALALSLSPRTAICLVNDAVAIVTTLPGLLRVVEDGKLDWYTLVAIHTRMANVLDPGSRSWARVQETLRDELGRRPRTHGAALSATERAIAEADPARAAERGKAAGRDRHITLYPEPDGMAGLSGKLKADDAYIADSVLDALADACRDHTRRTGSPDPRTHRQRRADAFTSIFRSIYHQTPLAIIPKSPDGTDTLSRPTTPPVPPPRREDPKAPARQRSSDPGRNSASAPTRPRRPATDSSSTSSPGPGKDTTSGPGNTSAAWAKAAVPRNGAAPSPSPDQTTASRNSASPVPTPGQTAVPRNSAPPVPAPGQTAVPRNSAPPVPTPDQTAILRNSAPPAPVPDPTSGSAPDPDPSLARTSTLMPDQAPAPDGVLAWWRTPPLPTQQGRRPHLVVTIDAATLLGLDDQLGKLQGYGVIPADLARDLAAQAGKITLLPDRPVHGPGDQSRCTEPSRRYRPRQSITDRVVARFQECVHPGCTRPAARCDLDHVVPFARGGRTCECNLVPQCRFHHRLKTHGGWKLRLTHPGEPHPAGTIEWESRLGQHHIEPPPTRTSMLGTPAAPAGPAAPACSAVPTSSATSADPADPACSTAPTDSAASARPAAPAGPHVHPVSDPIHRVPREISRPGQTPTGPAGIGASGIAPANPEDAIDRTTRAHRRRERWNRLTRCLEAPAASGVPDLGEPPF